MEGYEMSYKKMTNNNQKSTKFVVKDIPAYFLTDVSEDIENEVISTLKGVPFNRFSIPLNAYREDILGEENNHKCITIGFIKSFDPDTMTFNAIIFNAFKEAVDNFDTTGIEVNFGTYKDHLTRINRLALINVPALADDEDAEAADDAGDVEADDEEPSIEQNEDAE